MGSWRIRVHADLYRFLIENQVKEAMAQEAAAVAQSTNIEQALTQQVTNAYLDTVTFTQQIKLTEELVRTPRKRYTWPSSGTSWAWDRLWK